jgi:hypothetical protein
MSRYTLALLALALLVAGAVRAQESESDPSPAAPSPPLLPAADAPVPPAGPSCPALMPGCTQCIAARPSVSGRRLQAAAALADAASSVLSQFAPSSYQQPPNFFCTACNATAGYRLNPIYGRCGEACFRLRLRPFPPPFLHRFAGLLRELSDRHAADLRRHPTTTYPPPLHTQSASWAMAPRPPTPPARPAAPGRLRAAASSRSVSSAATGPGTTTLGARAVSHFPEWIVLCSWDYSACSTRIHPTRRLAGFCKRKLPTPLCTPTVINPLGSLHLRHLRPHRRRHRARPVRPLPQLRARLPAGVHYPQKLHRLWCQQGAV